MITGSPQNPNPTGIPANPISNPTPAAAVTTAKPPSFEEVSKLFSLPLSDAADSLGVCPSVLKKVCYENGLVRWPYRKFLVGKMIEEIKKDATIEKEKKFSAFKADRESKDTLASSVVSSSLAPQPQSMSTGLLQENPTSRILGHQPTKDNTTNSPHNTLNSAMNKGTSSTSDEFKYGFPSSAGLSIISFRWWGNEGNADNLDRQDAKETEQQCENLADTASAAADLSSDSAMAKNKMDAATQCASLLTGWRKKTAEEGRRALKLGVHRGYKAKTLDWTKKAVLLQIFKSSLPDEWKVED